HFFDLLKARGFQVGRTAFDRGDIERKIVWRISWRFEYVGQATPALWNLDVPMLYRFMPWEKKAKGFPCPLPFDVDAFALDRGCSPDSLRPTLGSHGKSYLRVMTTEAALQLLQHSASRIDELYYPSTSRDDPAALLADLAAVEA